MSIKVMSMVWDSGLPSMERLVLLAVADFCDDQGRCWPSIARIAEKCGMSDRGVRKILRRLEDAGWLETDVGGGRHGCSQYTVKPGTTFPPEPRSPRNTSAETRNQSARNPEPRSAEPSRTIKNRQRDTAREILMTVLRPETADAFIAHRAAKRSKLTEHAAILIAKKLAGHSDPDAVVEETIANGWTGVFPNKEKSHASSKPRSASAARAARVAARFERGDPDMGSG